MPDEAAQRPRRLRGVGLARARLGHQRLDPALGQRDVEGKFERPVKE